MEVNGKLLNLVVENVKTQTSNCFKNKDYIYTALALQNMGYTDEQILEMIAEEIKEDIPKEQ